MQDTTNPATKVDLINPALLALSTKLQAVAGRADATLSSAPIATLPVRKATGAEAYAGRIRATMEIEQAVSWLCNAPVRHHWRRAVIAMLKADLAIGVKSSTLNSVLVSVLLAIKKGERASSVPGLVSSVPDLSSRYHPVLRLVFGLAGSSSC